MAGGVEPTGGSGGGADRPHPETDPGQPVAGAVPGTVELFRTFLVVGVSAFGMAIMQAVRSTPVRRRWLSRHEVDEGFAVVQMYPGPIMMDLVAFIGYRLRRVRGGLAAAAGFLAPSLLLVLGMSWAYFTYGTHPEVRDLVVGLNALVVGVLVSVTLDFGAEYARAKLPAIVALGAFAVGVSGVSVLWAVLGAFAVGVVAMRGDGDAVPPATVSAGPLSRRRLVLAGVPALIVVACVAVAALASGAVAALVVDMAKIGSIAFGNGTVILPILQQDAVGHHWLTASEFSAGVAIGQVTPGPIMTTAAFVGFAAAGWWGGLAAGLAIFAPSVALTMIVGEVYPYLRRLSWVRGAIAGLMAGFTGLLASMILILGRPILPVPAALGLAGAAFVALRVLRWNTLTIFALGIAIWSVYLAAGGPR